MLCKSIDRTPLWHGSVRGPDKFGEYVRSPELSTQWSEAQEHATRLSKSVDTGKLQNVAVRNMEGELKASR